MPAPLAAHRLLGVDLRDEAHAAEHPADGHRLRRAHAAQPGAHDEAPAQAAAEVLARHLGERLIRALEHALGPDVLPTAGGEAAPGDQVAPLQVIEDLGRGPAPDKVAVGQEHSRAARAGGQHRDRLARLHDERLAVAQVSEGGDDAPQALVVARRLGVGGVDHEVLRILGDGQVVLEQAQDRLLAPATAAQGRVRHVPRGSLGRWFGFRPPARRHRRLVRRARARRPTPGARGCRRR